MGKKGFYAVARGRTVGIYDTWDECKAQVDGFSGPRYKKFNSREEADDFILANSGHSFSASTSARKPFNFPQTSRKRTNADAPSYSQLESKRAKSMSIPDDLPVVYTDGACSQNGRKGAKAGWGVFWGHGHQDNSCGPVYGAATNNRGELQAVSVALSKAIEKNMSAVVVRTDSQLLINSMDSWIHKWKRNGWKTGDGDVKNVDLLKDIDAKRSQVKVYFEHVRGHAGIDGNEAADALAREGAKRYGNQ